MRYKKIVLNFIFGFIFLVFCINILYWRSYNQLSQGYQLILSSNGCDLPKLDPWDQSILSYIIPQSPLKCSKVQYELTRLDPNGTLYINEKEVKESGLSVNCFQRCYDKSVGNDQTINYTDWKSLKKPVQINCEFIEVYCRRSSFPRTTVYRNNHNQIIVRGAQPRDVRDFKPSVVLFVLDSVSHSSWRRNLPKTYEVLKRMYNSYIFDGMSKVGDHSFPNAVAFLTGKIANSEFGDVNGYFDDHPLIWKDYEKANYSTYYAEDYPDFNLFYYLAKGFREKPVHHYFRPFWLNVYGSYLHRRSSNLCYGENAMHNLQLNYLSQMITKYKASPFFALNWLTELAHDFMNVVQVADDDISTFFTDHYEYLENSFLFVMSDHGHRFDAIRETAIGRLEERLPFFSVHIPEKLREKYGNLDGVLKKNSQVLTTFWDVYVTLRDILYLTNTQKWDELDNLNSTLDSEQNARFRTYSKRGSSLLRPIKARSCLEAEVPEEFCVCTKEKPIDPTDKIVQKAALHLISHLNNILSPYPQCAQLTLGHVKHAQTPVTTSEHVTSQKYRISIVAQPSEAVFESLLQYDTRRDTLRVVGDVNRVNRYGNQSICVDLQELRKYCFCT